MSDILFANCLNLCLLTAFYLSLLILICLPALFSSEKLNHICIIVWLFVCNRMKPSLGHALGTGLPPESKQIQQLTVTNAQLAASKLPQQQLRLLLLLLLVSKLDKFIRILPSAKASFCSVPFTLQHKRAYLIKLRSHNSVSSWTRLLHGHPTPPTPDFFFTPWREWNYANDWSLWSSAHYRPKWDGKPLFGWKLPTSKGLS